MSMRPETIFKVSTLEEILENYLSFIIFFIISCGLPQNLLADSFSGKVVRVADGDTITVLNGSRTEKIRLFGVDAPEKGQAYWKASKWFVSNKVFGKIVTVNRKEKGRYGRTIAQVTTSEKTDLGLELLSRGYGWWYRRYAPEEKSYEAAEKKARKERVGLFADNSATPPWKWRQRQSHISGKYKHTKGRK